MPRQPLPTNCRKQLEQSVPPSGGARSGAGQVRAGRDHWKPPGQRGLKHSRFTEKTGSGQRSV